MRNRFFRALAALDFNHPFMVLAVSLALAVASVLYTRARLEFRTGQDDLISANSRDSRNYLAYTHQFPDLDGIIIVVRATPDPKRAEHFVDALAGRLTADRANVKSVFYRIDSGAFADRAMLYMSVAELNAMGAKIRAAYPMVDAYAAKPGLTGFFGTILDQTRRAMAANGGGGSRPADPRAGSDAHAGANEAAANESAQAMAGADSTAALNRLLRSMLAYDKTGKYESPWDSLAAGGGRNGVLRDGYLVTDNGKYLLMHVAPGDGVPDGADPTDAVEADIQATRTAIPGVEAGMTGGPALARAEETTTAHDVALASVIAITSNVLLIVVPFRAIVEPLFAVIALLMGVAWSFGFTTLAIGHLNLLSAVFTSVLAGIGINFPIHLMARYDEARRQGLATRRALELAVVNTGTGVFASACIMALAFLMPLFTDFKGIAELGIVSAAGLFMCLLSALFVFPALIAIRDRNRAPRRPRPRSSTPSQASILEALFRRPGVIVAVTIVATLATVPLAMRVRFDQNVLKLQAESSEAVRFENKLLKDSGRSSWFAVSLAPTIEAADARAAAFRRLAEVSDSETIATYVPGDQPAKLAILHSLAAPLSSVTIPDSIVPSRPDLLIRELSELSARFKAIAQADPGNPAAITAGLLDAAIARMRVQPDAFAGFESQLNQDLGAQIVRLKRYLTPTAVTVANLPRVVRDRFISPSGLYLVQVYPRGDIWGDAALERFVTAVKTVDPDVTGPPVQTYNMATVMRRGYERAAVLALIAVFIFVLADFRSLRDAGLATVPLIFGGAWLLAAMGGLKWEFNLANLFAVPILIGTGVDNGVNMLYRWREERDRSALILRRAVGKSVMICSLTTIGGFAALIPAMHRGISSLGWVLSLGVAMILFATMIVLPAMFELIGRRDNRAAAAGDDQPTEPQAEMRSHKASGGLGI